MTFASRMELLVRSLFLQACWSDERRQALGWAWMLAPELRRAWPEGPERRAAFARHLSCFNTNPHAAPAIAGVVCALEERAARAPAAERAAQLARAAQLKAALAAGLGGLGDAFFWGALRPFAAAVGLAAFVWSWYRAPLWPSAACLLVFAVPALAVRWTGLSWGRELGEGLAGRLKELPLSSWQGGLRWGAALLALEAARRSVSTASGPFAGSPGAGAAVLALYLLALRAKPELVTATRAYAAALLAGVLAGAAGWVG